VWLAHEVKHVPQTLLHTGTPLGLLARGTRMVEVVYERCCGLDIHKQTVVACLIVPSDGAMPHKEIRTFGTLTDELLQLADWLAEVGCTHVAMESTGVFWKPLYNLLEGSFELLLVNARHIKQVPGRKTDVQDCEWIADLLRHGLLRGSFVPDRPQRELRELTRYRSALIRERAAEVNRVQKTLEGANIKLGAVATDVLGVSGREMLAALVAGTNDPAGIAALAQGKLRHKLPELERALTGRVGAHQRFMLAKQLAHLDALDELIEQVSAEVQERLRPFVAAVARLDTIPGVGLRTAETLVAELGADLSRFPTAAHLASWAGMCPGHDESAGKRRSGKTRKGDRWLRIALIEAAQAAARKRDSYLRAQYQRLAARRGKKKALVAVGHTILVIAYHLLTEQAEYRELGPLFFDQRDEQRVTRRLVQRLQNLGYTVNLERPAA
jgi:transposase